MAKKIYNAMYYRSGMTPDAGFGAELLQTCNRGFYGKDSAGVEKPNIQPNWSTDVEIALAKIDLTKAVYFDLEPWLCNPVTKIDVLTQKLYAGTLVSQYRSKNPSGSVLLYGHPGLNFNPLNPQATIDAWRASADMMMTKGGELSDLIMSNIDILSFSAYPSEYTGKDDPIGSFPTQVKFNQLCLDMMKANNPRKLPIYGWFQPRMGYRADGKRHFLDYKTTVANVSWILSNCDGMIIWDWDGYGDPDKGTTVAVWDTSMPWYQGVKDCIAAANAAPTYSNLFSSVINKFPSNLSAV